MSILIAVLTVLSFIRDTGKFIWTLIETHVGYIICYKKNIKDFDLESKNLEAIGNDVQISINEAENKGENIKNEVLIWRKREAETTQNINDLENKIKPSSMCCGGWLPDLCFRYKIGKQSAEMRDKISTLLEEKRFVSVSLPAPPSKFQPPRDFQLFASTKVSMDAIMNALIKDNVECVGLFGVTGVGKTYLAKKVGHEAQEKGLFDQIVLAVVSKNPDVRKIQGQIADKLKLKLLEESEQGRADRLKDRIKRSKKILVILDDVWGFIDLTQIGIPYGNELYRSGCKCKILVTTTRGNGFHYIGRQEMVVLELLSAQDSWILFSAAASLEADSLSPEFISVARRVAGGCRGVPLCLVKFGRGLAGKDLSVWRIAARELEASLPCDVHDMEQLFTV